MKRRSFFALFAVMVVALIAAAVITFIQRTSGSPLAPEIRFDNDAPLRVSIQVSDEELLQGVTATDPEDGDVTASLIVEGISRLGSDATATVTYAAFDSKHHVAKASRQVEFTDYTPPRFTLSAPLLYAASDRVNLLNCFGAEDMVDGDLTDRVRYTITGGGSSISDVGLYELELRVTNSLGGTSVLPVTVEVTATSPNPARITLSDYLVYVEQGAAFDPKAYVTSYRADGQTASSAEGLSIDNSVNTAMPGVYTVTYTYSAATLSQTRLIVVVE